MTYTDIVATVANLMGNTSTSDPNFSQILPQMIAAGELRIYRDMDLLATVVRDSSLSTSAGMRDFTLPSTFGQFVVVDGINVITPASTSAAGGTRNPLLCVSRDVLDLLWPSASPASTSTIPTQFAMITDQKIIFGPTPGDTYNVEIIGTVRPASLSATNTTTYLSTYFADLLTYSMMIYASGYQKNFGSQADNPAQSISWQNQYDRELASANIEEARKRFSAASWTSKRAEPAAVPQRG